MVRREMPVEDRDAVQGLEETFFPREEPQPPAQRPPPAPPRQRQEESKVEVVGPFHPESGVIHAKAKVTDVEVSEGGVRTRSQEVEYFAYGDDGRVFQGIKDFNRSPHTGATFTNASAKRCQGCGAAAFSRELAPSQVHPSSCVCPDCQRHGT